MSGVVTYDDFGYPIMDICSGTGFPKYNHEFHAASTVVLGELVEAGWFDLNDKETWKWPKYSDEQDDRLRIKIVTRYYNREIGVLPIKLFKRQFVELMNELMPKYMNLYRLLDESPQMVGASSEYYKSRNIFSDFPQTQLGGNSDYGSSGNDTEYERIKQLDILELAERLKSYKDVDTMILDELDCMFSCLVSVGLNTR